MWFEIARDLDLDELSAELYEWSREIYPWGRSITGKETVRTLKWIQEKTGIEIKSVPSGTKVLDWEVPLEWNVEEAWVKDEQGNVLVDYRDHKLHLLNYSISVDKIVSREELLQHLFYLKERPDLIPYRTSYYNRDWGFCIPYSWLSRFKGKKYRVKIASTLSKGYLHYGELLVKGKSKKEVVLTTHICHPQMANDNVSGIVVLSKVASIIKDIIPELSFRFLFIPGTIGSITWLALNKDNLSNIKAGLVISAVGDRSGFNYKRSRKGDSFFDKFLPSLARDLGDIVRIHDFHPYGYDERQFCSPGFNLPFGLLSRAQWGTYKEYHTSGDNLSFIEKRQLSKSVRFILYLLGSLDANKFYLNLYPYGEPQLGKRGLYERIGGESKKKELQLAFLWVLNYSDGTNSLTEISLKSGMPFYTIAKAATILEEAQLIKQIDALEC